MRCAVALALVGALMGAAAARATDRPSGINYYEPATVVVGGGEGAAQGELGSAVVVDAFGRRFELDVEPNDKFTHGGRTTWLGPQTGGVDFQLYKGHLRGSSDSWVRLAVIDGQLHGTIWTPDEVVVLQPGHTVDPSAPSDQTVAYRDSDIDVSAFGPASCGVEGAQGAQLIAPGNAATGPSLFDGGSGQATQLMEAGVYLIADNEYSAKHTTTTDADLRYLLSLVDAIYEREVNISLAVAGVLIFDPATNPPTVDPFDSTNDPNSLLNEVSAFHNVQKYCTNRPILYCSNSTSTSCQTNSNCPTGGTCLTNSCTSDTQCGSGNTCTANPTYGSDLTHLVTARDLASSTIGIAWIGAVCSTYYGSGLSQDFSSSTFTMSLLTAHEIGHNFSAQHDASSNPCGDPPPRYIMQACLSSSVIDQFSTTSKNAIIPYSQGLGCLSPAGTPLPTNTPTSTATPAPPTSTPTRTPTRTATLTITPTWTKTSTAPPPPTATWTSTPTVTLTRTPSNTPTVTQTATVTATRTATPTNWPPAFSGLTMWLDATQITGVANGAAVTAWPDMSGNGHHATQSTATNKPTYQLGAVNGQAGVRFDGTNDYLSITGVVASGAQARTVLVVGRPTVVGNKGFVDLGKASTSGAAFMLSSEYGVRAGSGNIVFNSTAAAGTPALYVVELTGSTPAAISGWVNGAPLGVASTTSVTIATAGTGIVGGWSANPVGANSYSGDIAEIIVYNRALSNSERQLLEQYLSAKYALTWLGDVQNGTPTATAVASTPTSVPTATATAPASGPTATNTATSVPTSTSTAVPPTVPPTSTATSGAPTSTPTVNANVPQTVPNLELWLDASQLTGLSDGAAVSPWNDASGHAHNGTQATSTNRPTYQSAALNGQPAVRFDGTNDYLSLAGTVVSGSQARTVFFVARPDSAANKGIVDLGNGSTTGAGFMISPEFAVRVNGGSRTWTPGADTSAATLGVVQLTGTSTSNLTLSINGVARTATSTAAVTIQTAGSGTVGTWTATPVGSNNFSGDIAEIIVYTRALTVTEVQTVQQYLATKYSLP